MYDIQPEGVNTKETRCPEINIKIENIEVKALIDTGSEITCISEEFYYANAQAFKTRPMLPISGKFIKGATGAKSSRLKLQVLLTVEISNLKLDIIFIVVPKLVKPCIIGYDTQKALSMLIDTGKEEILLTLNNTYVQCSYKEAIMYSEEYASLRIEQSYESDGENADLYDDVIPYDLSYDVSIEEIDDKIRSCKNLEKSQREKLRCLIVQYKEVFQKRPGLLSNYEYTFKLKDNAPFYSKPYPIPINYRDKVKVEIEKWQELGIIRRSTSPYINPLVVVIKKDGTIRLCLDARKLNEKLVSDYESPPGVEEIFLKCKNVNFLSSFDLTNSFHQINLSEESRKYTAFICDNRVYEFNVVPFGIKTSNAALIRGLDLAVAGLEDFLITFVDDLLCISEDFDSHLKNIQQLIENLLRNNLRISFKKSKLVQEEIKFLGHILTPEGVKPDDHCNYLFK